VLLNNKRLLPANPLGKGTSFGNLKIMRDALETKYRALISKYDSKFKLRVIKVKKDLFFQIIVPSESVTDLTYDVVIKFIDGADLSNLAGCKIQLFSNNPHFNYTYAYAFNKDNLLIDDLKRKIDKQALTEIPKIKNTELVTGFDKTLFFAYFYIMSLGATKSSFFNNMVVSSNLPVLTKLVKTTKEKETEYNTLKKLMTADVKKQKTKKIKLDGKTTKVEKPAKKKIVLT
jgi:hypothetical protein